MPLASGKDKPSLESGNILLGKHRFTRDQSAW